MNKQLVKIKTASQRPDLKQQQINIDICRLPSHEKRPAMLKNHYGLEMGTSGLIIMAESLSEILADKIVALALRPNRVKNRDLWDIYQIKNHNTDLSLDMLKQKLTDRRISLFHFRQLYSERLNLLKKRQQAFLSEMRRFISGLLVNFYSFPKADIIRMLR